MGRNVLFVADPPETFDPRADSTYVMVHRALELGHTPHIALLSDLSLDGATAMGRAQALALDGAGAPLRRTGQPRRCPLAEFDVVIMRKDPPVDDAFLTATWILDRAQADTLVVNDPQGLREINEKLSILNFPDLTPRTMISRREDELRAFLSELGGRMIVKPVFGFGGREILLARQDDPNLGTILEVATDEGRRWTVAQAYVPEATEGDKRILLVDGEPIGAVLRVPSDGELRNNFHAGGTPAAIEVDDRDRAICSALAPFLGHRGQFFVGIDVIGGLLTEINVTSPTGMQEINRLGGLTGDATMEARFWAALESKLGAGRGS